jgi:chromosome segregation and condensation protein ScpB
VVGRLRDAGLIEEFAGEGGRLVFATTARFLVRFGFTNHDELNRTLANGAV